jgi:4-alpha-glucanotransferase
MKGITNKENRNKMERRAGILCPVFSIPSNQGIGDFGTKTEKMIDIIADAGYKIWQILPLQVTGPTHSPYQTLSSFAGDPIYINIDRLSEMGLITQSSIVNCNKFRNFVDYDKVRTFKEKYFRRAFHSFKKEFDAFKDDYHAFKQSAFWLDDWAVFQLFHDLHEGKDWTQWDEEYKQWPYDKSAVDLRDYEDELFYIKFLQYIFYKQFDDIVMYAHSRGLEVMGDIPFYVDLDSADMWTNREDFMIDREGNASFVAGCPPDYFSADGQRWGMPVYNFEHQINNDFSFWTRRMRWMSRCCDMIRIDHFRAFDTYWKIPSSCPTAVEGEWIESPGENLLRAIIDACPGIQMVAEDLGDQLRPELYALEREFGIPGMELLLFKLESKVLKKPLPEHIVLYTGTHDNETVCQAYQSFSNNKRISLRRFFKKRGYTHRKFNELVCHFALDSEADTVILPIWDICGYKEEARINTPGTISDKNWTWKLKDFKTFPALVANTKDWVENAGR